MGSVTGLAVTLESIGKMLGPALGAPLFGLLISYRPLATNSFSGAHATFLTFGMVAAALSAVAVGLPAAIVDGVPRKGLQQEQCKQTRG